MSLAEKLEAAKPVQKPRFEQQLEQLPKEDLAALEAAARDSTWSNSAIVRVLNDEGIRVGKDAFGTWRRRVESR